MPIPISQLVSQIRVDLGDSENALRQHKQTLTDTGQASQQVGKAQAEMGDRATQLRAKIIELSSDLSGLRGRLKDLEGQNANLNGLLTPNIQQTRTEMAQLQGQLVGVRGELRDLGKTTQDTGNIFGASTAHILRYAVAYEGLRVARQVVGDLAQASIGLQTSMLRTAALTDVSAGEIGKFSTEITRLSGQTGKSAKELGDAFYFIASSGLSGADALKTLDVSAKASAAGLGETKVVADAVTSALNAYKLSGDQATKITDVLVQAVKEGKGEASDFAGAMGKVLPIASAAGVSFEQVAASMAIMTRTGLTAEEAATALRGTLGELERPGKDAQKALAEVGLSAETVRANIRDKGLLVTLQDLYQRTDGNVEVLGRIIPNIRALTGVLSSAGSQADAYAQVLGAMNEAQGSTARAFETTSASVELQASRVKAAFEAMGIEASKNVLPAVADVASGMADSLAPSTKKTAEEMNRAQSEGHSFGETLGGLVALAGAFGSSALQLIGKLGELATAMGNVRIAGRNMWGTTAEAEEAKARMLRVFEIQRSMSDPQNPYAFNPDQELLPRETARSPELQARIDAAKAAAAAAGSVSASSNADYGALRADATAMAEMTSEARKLHDVMADLWKLPDDADPKVIEAKLKDLAKEEATQETAWRRAFDPQEAGTRISRLSGLIDNYTNAIKNQDAAAQQAAQGQISAYLAELAARDTAAASQRRQDTEDRAAAAQRKRDADERARADREARQADPLVGIREAMARDREDLIGTAGRVMADLQNAVSLKGQQGARAAGEQFGNEARKWGEELEKAGVPGWQDAFNRLMALAEVAVVTGSKDVIGALHDLLAEGEQEIRQANIGKAMAEATTRANAQVLESQSRTDEQLLQAQASAADARANALQSEVDREYDIWAGKQVDRLTQADQNARELSRIQEEWGREDLDRADQRSRERADREEQSYRAQQDRARDAARSLRDLQEGQTRAQADQGRARAREEADAAYEHDKRLRAIAARGGPDAAKATADENASYQQSLADRARKRQQDDAEASIKRAEQVADAQKRIAEQAADAQRRAGEQASDLAKRQGEQESDLTKSRARQLQSRKDQQDDAEYLKGQREKYEQEFYVDAESKAQRQYQNELARIDARYQHEVEKAATASDLIQAKREHDLADAEIKARARFGDIQPDEAARLEGANDLSYVQRQAELQRGLRERETAIDAALRDQIANSRQYAPGFSAAAAGAARQSSIDWKSGWPWQNGQESVASMWQARAGTFPLTFLPGQSATPGPIDVRIVDIGVQAVTDLADAASDRPVQMDGEDVEDVQSRVRRTRALSRAQG